MFRSIIIPFIILQSFVSAAQFKVQTIYTNDFPNRNCYFSYDNNQLGLTNRNGIIYINDSLKGSVINIEDLETGLKYKFTLSKDTTIITDQVQELEEVQIKPRDRKKLLDEVFEKNQDRLPEKLNIKGTVYIAELYILNSGNEPDTVLKIFTCDMVIVDVFGNMKIQVKNPIKLKKGEAHDQELFEKASSLMRPEKNFQKKTQSQLNYSSFLMKKYRKFNSQLINKKERKNLLYTTTDSTNLFVDRFGKVNKYSWRKKDSALLFMSKYYFQESEGSNMFNVPFSNIEYSNPEGRLAGGYVSTETLLEIGDTQTNIFYYFAMENIIKDTSTLSDYTPTESFEEMYSNTRTKQMRQIPDPKIYPLKFPFLIFF